MRKPYVQMSTVALYDIAALLVQLETEQISDTARALCARVEASFQAKINAAERRHAFTAYKTAAPGSDERERARQAYLELAGVAPEWQSKRETRD